MSESWLDRSLDFTRRMAIATGGGTWIGAATAKLRTAQGAAVVVVGRTPGPLEAVFDDIRSESSPACLAVPTDLKVELSSEALVERTLRKFNRVHGRGRRPDHGRADYEWDPR